MTQIHIPRRPLRAMLHIASKFDVRFYLVGVYVEASPYETRLTATDGHMLGTYRHVLPHDGEPNYCGAASTWCGILTRASIDALPKPDKRALPICVLSDLSGVLRIDDGATVDLHDGQFPDYRQMFRSLARGARKNATPAQFDPALIRRYQNFGRDGLERKKAVPLLRHAGCNAALVGFAKCPEFAGVVMPLRLDAPILPAWVADPVGAVEAKAEPQGAAA